MPAGPEMDGIEALKVLNSARTDEIVVLHEANRQEWPTITRREELDISWVGAMSKASSFGLGVAMARPDQRVWVLDSDGALLMNLGALVTIAQAKPANLLHVVYDNGAYDTTGGQPTPGAGVVDFAAIALASGYPRAVTYRTIEELERGLPDVLAGPWPTLLLLKVASKGKRVPVAQRATNKAFWEIKDYLAQHPA